MILTTQTLRRVAALAAIVCLPATARASLGGSASTVESDRVAMEGALMRMTHADTFALHEIRSAAGVMVREYVSPSGTVFAVVWQGPWMPDLRQVLGDHFERFERSMQARRARRSRGPVSIDEPDFVVQVSGHQRSFYGRAYLPALLPQGVRPEAIR